MSKNIGYRILLLLLISTIFFVNITYALTAGEELQSMGLLTGKAGGDLAEDEYLTRTEMMVILARMLGEFEQAKSWQKPSSFKDGNNHWGEHYVAYAENRNWTAGIGNNLFGYDQHVTVRSVSVYMLKALGYIPEMDFTWINAYEKAVEFGMFSGMFLDSESDMLRGDLFSVMMNTLNHNLKYQAVTLSQSLGVKMPGISETTQNHAIAAVSKDGKWGYIDESGNKFIDLKYDDAYSFSEGLALVVINGKTGFINEKGELVIDTIYEDGDKFSSGLAPVKKNGVYGYVDKFGKIIIEPQFMLAGFFSEGLARVVVNNKTGFIDLEGNFIIQPQFDFANNFINGLAAVVVDKKVGYIDKNGEYVIAPAYDIAGDYKDGLLRFNNELDLIGFMDGKGQEVLPAILPWAENFSEGVAVVYDYDGKAFYIDKYMTVMFDAQKFEEAYNFSEGLAVVKMDGLYGVIDKLGNWIVNPKFENASQYGYSSGMLAVEVDGKFGYIDRTGKMIIEPQYDMADHFVER